MVISKARCQYPSNQVLLNHVTALKILAQISIIMITDHNYLKDCMRLASFISITICQLFSRLCDLDKRFQYGNDTKYRTEEGIGTNPSNKFSRQGLMEESPAHLPHLDQVFIGISLK
jgi:hypothetical protein